MFTTEFEKTAGRGGATAVGGMLPVASGLAADEGKGWQTTGGAVLGSIAGAALGRRLSGVNAKKLSASVTKRMSKNLPVKSGDISKAKKLLLSGAAGSAAGGAGGAYLAHGKDKKDE